MEHDNATRCEHAGTTRGDTCTSTCMLPCCVCVCVTHMCMCACVPNKLRLRIYKTRASSPPSSFHQIQTKQKHRKKGKERKEKRRIDTEKYYGKIQISSLYFILSLIIKHTIDYI